MRSCLLAVALAFAPLAGASAQTPPNSPAPNVVIQGSPDVSVGNAPAARQGDATKDAGAVVSGSPNVFINGKPAALAGGKTGCGGAIISGGSNVFINGKPMARAGDQTAGCAH